MAEFIRIKGWDNYQHYKDRNPPWIKLHQEMLTGQTWIMGNDHQKALMITVMLLAARTDNCIPANPEYIQKVAHLDVAPDLDWLCSTGFCERTDKAEVRESPWPSRYISAELREVVFARDGHKCRMCNSRDKLEVDHVIPVSKGGVSKVDNLQTLCRSCNRKKRARMAVMVDGVAIATENFELSSTKTETETEQRKRQREMKRKSYSPHKPAEVLPVDSWHSRIKAMVQSAWSEHNDGIECPWGAADGAQLKMVRDRSPGWHDGQYAQCLANLYASVGFPRSKLPFEFLPRLCSFLSGPRNEFNQEKGNGSGNSKGDRRAADISKTTREVFGSGGIVHGNDPARLQVKAASAGVGVVAGNTQGLLVSGIQSGDDPPDKQPSKV